MPRFHFDLAYGGDVYHDATGTSLPDEKQAKDRAFEIVRRLAASARSQDIVCTLRDVNGALLMKIRVNDGSEPCLDSQGQAPTLQRQPAEKRKGK
jgi:hypothetical protein